MNSYSQMAELYDSLMYDVEYDGWAEYIDRLLKKYNAPGRRVFETACGTGSLTIRLKKMGWDVQASDLSGEMLMAAQEKARKNGLKVEFICQDMRKIDVENRDAVICACDGVNYLTEGLAEFLQGVYRGLKKGGVIAFDISSSYKLREIVGDQLFFDDGDDVTWIWQNSLEKNTVHMELSFFIRNGGIYIRKDESHVQRIYETEEVLEAMRAAGFVQCGAFGFLTETAPEKDAERIQFIGKKPL